MLEAAEIQGNVLRGFNTSHQILLGLMLPRPVGSAARAWIAGLPVTPLGTTAIWRAARREARSLGQAGAPDPLTGLAISHSGAQALGLPVAGIRDGYFGQPMGMAADQLGDRVEDGAAADYLYGLTWDDTPDIMLILGGDDATALGAAAAAILSDAVGAGVRSLFSERGEKQAGEKEHFGFKDGISQPAPRGLLSNRPDDYLYQRMIPREDPRAAAYAWPGKPLVWPGQYVFGYAGHSRSSFDLPNPPVTGGEPWMRNGSFLVYRRLRQDVTGFRAWCASQAAAMTAATAGTAPDPDAFAARVVGRWPDGTPFHVAPGGPDTALSDDVRRANHFGYDKPTGETVVVDELGARTVPGAPGDKYGLIGAMCAHIRKVNPRDLEADKGSPNDTLRLQMLRRGIPYGPPHVEGEPGGVDRGLLFLSYQTSIANQFMKLVGDWMNHGDKPERGGEGHDLLVGQDRRAGRFGSFPRNDGSLFTAQAPRQFVNATGGAFLFSPAISVIRGLIG